MYGLKLIDEGYATKIALIVEFRKIHPCGLAEAKKQVEDLMHKALMQRKSQRGQPAWIAKNLTKDQATALALAWEEIDAKVEIVETA